MNNDAHFVGGGMEIAFFRAKEFTFFCGSKATVQLTLSKVNSFSRKDHILFVIEFGTESN